MNTDATGDVLGEYLEIRRAGITEEAQCTESIRIGGIEYLVIEREELRDDGERIDGQFCHTESEIRLDAALGPQARRATLWHEILHGVLVHAGYTDEHDERMIAALAYGVMQVLQDNPVMRDLTKQKTRGTMTTLL